ncbi:MAG TPA: hypothetical protein DCE78_01460 [Bacteroidetes bacterium]|nr:hypothetical protein [Bacteroidota bacterium]
MKKIGLLLGLLAFSNAAWSQDVLKLGPDEAPGTASLEDVSWLQGYWTGTGLGGEVDELWMPAMDNSMIGVFRLMMNGQLIFSEYMFIEELNGTISVKLKHFNKDLTAWEEKEKWTEFKLVKVEGQKAWFSGLTYERNEDELTIKLNLTSQGVTRVESFNFKRTEL